MKRSLLILSILSLTGCTTWDLQKLRRTEPKGSVFQQTLAKEYLAFSESEAKQCDWMDSQHFAEKGLRAAYGQPVEPEMPGEWRIPKTLLPTLEQAHSRLMNVLRSSARDREPEHVAKMQFYFDCWVEQQEENWQEDDIRICREGFYELLNRFSGGAAPAPAAATPAPMPVEKTDQKPVMSYMIFFSSGSAKLDKQGEEVITHMINDLKNMGADEVVISGHTDRVGTDKYNLDLSRNRAETVKNRLVSGGIMERAIRLFAYGEQKPREATVDGVSKAANRRVEIFVSDE